MSMTRKDFDILAKDLAATWQYCNRWPTWGWTNPDGVGGDVVDVVVHRLMLNTLPVTNNMFNAARFRRRYLELTGRESMFGEQKTEV